MNLEKYGFTQEMVQGNVVFEEAAIISARVTAVHRERYQLVCEHGEIYARLKTKEYYVELEEFPTTGDFVAIRYIPNGDSQIIKTLPRKTFFSRLDPTPGRGEQAVAANFDYVFIMQSLNHDFNAKRLERYMTLAWQSGATPIIVLTKADLVEDYDEYCCQYKSGCTRSGGTSGQFKNRLWHGQSEKIFAAGEDSCIFRFLRCRQIKSFQCIGRERNHGCQWHT